MSDIGQLERATQNRVIVLFREELGYRYLGDWTDRDGNSNIEENLLALWLTKNGYAAEQVNRAVPTVSMIGETGWVVELMNQWAEIFWVIA